MITSSSLYYIVQYVHIFLVPSLVSGSFESAEFLNGNNAVGLNQTAAVYNVGVRVGIIDPEKYSLKAFQKHEKVLKTLHKSYNEMEDVEPLSYQEWLLLNNYGILRHNQFSVFRRKKKSMATNRYKKAFIQATRKGDILITYRVLTGLMGHAGIIATDRHALEMKGGKNWILGIKNNNRRLTKSEWFDEYSGFTHVFRCLNKELGINAARWAYRYYYNPHDGDDRTIFITYRVTSNFIPTNPSYCAKLVLQAYYYTNCSIIKKVPQFIIPVKLPDYFDPSCQMVHVGRY